MVRKNFAGANTQQYEKNTMNYGSTNDIQRNKTLNVAVFDNNLQNRFVTISPDIKKTYILFPQALQHSSLVKTLSVCNFYNTDAQKDRCLFMIRITVLYTVVCSTCHSIVVKVHVVWSTDNSQQTIDIAFFCLFHC